MAKADALAKNLCPSCDSAAMSVFYELRNVPVHSVLLMRTREIAKNYPKGDIILGFCQNCGFISNVAFDSAMLEYSDQYEATQSFSPTFKTFHQRLATRLIDRYDLHDKVIIEIGCGKGDFLTMLCELGGNRGIGFDPAYISEPDGIGTKDRVTFIRDFYSEKYSNYRADFVCCKMTLEHIQHTADFVSTVRRSIGRRSNTMVFFQVPNVTRILRDSAFEDIYYEHCSYFSPGSLARLFRKCSFDVLDLETGYDGQYLMIGAKPATSEARTGLPLENDLEKLKEYVATFEKNYKSKLDYWQKELHEIKANGKRAVLWGSSSKGVAFLTTLKIFDEIAYVVDINPHRQGSFMPGTGQEIVAPSFLIKFKPDIVIVMNPTYLEEIMHDLNQMSLTPKVLTV